MTLFAFGMGLLVFAAIFLFGYGMWKITRIIKGEE